MQGLYSINKDLDLLFLLQLAPELAESLSKYKKVCFIDAHTGNLQELIHFEEIHPMFQRSPFTHHLTPQSLLSITQSLYQSCPLGTLLSIRGYEFGFYRSLSEKTNAMVIDSLPLLLDWVSDS